MRVEDDGRSHPYIVFTRSSTTKLTLLISPSRLCDKSVGSMRPLLKTTQLCVTLSFNRSIAHVLIRHPVGHVIPSFLNISPQKKKETEREREKKKTRRLRIIATSSWMWKTRFVRVRLDIIGKNIISRQGNRSNTDNRVQNCSWNEMKEKKRSKQNNRIIIHGKTKNK